MAQVKKYADVNERMRAYRQRKRNEEQLIEEERRVRVVAHENIVRRQKQRVQELILGYIEDNESELSHSEMTYLQRIWAGIPYMNIPVDQT